MTKLVIYGLKASNHGRSCTLHEICGATVNEGDIFTFSYSDIVFSDGTLLPQTSAEKARINNANKAIAVKTNY